MPAVRHRRMGEGLDVALCGVRSTDITQAAARPRFAMSQKYVTCEGCKAKYAGLRGTNRMAEQMKAKREKARGSWSRGIGGSCP